MYIYVHTYIYQCVYIYICMYVYICIYIHAYGGIQLMECIMPGIKRMSPSCLLHVVGRNIHPSRAPCLLKFVVGGREERVPPVPTSCIPCATSCLTSFPVLFSGPVQGPEKTRFPPKSVVTVSTVSVCCPYAKFLLDVFVLLSDTPLGCI